MRNAEIAKVIREIGELLELKGENYFKVLAYQRAADSIEHLDFELEDVDLSSASLKIKNVGESIMATIRELVATGESKKHKQLLAEFPEGFLSLLEIPGVGPKKAKALLDHRGVRSIDDLARVAREGRIRDLPGFGEKTEQNILKGIEQYWKHRERMTLPDADRIASQILLELSSEKSIVNSSVAGSLRRMKETIGDIDVLVASQDPSSVMRAFVNAPVAYEVLAQGETKASIRTAEGIQSDLRVVEPSEYGSALLYFTGSKEHNIQLREIALKKGMKLNEYGLFDIDSGRLVASGSEEEIYEALGMAYIIPLLREGKGEIELAIKRELPDVIKDSEIKGDFHVHSNFSDGANSIAELVEAAIRMGYQYIGIADHARNLRIAAGLSEEDVAKQHEEIRKVEEEYGFRIFKGIELNIDLDGRLDFDDDFLARFDFTIASIHSGFRRSRTEQTARLIAAMRNPYVTIIGHPTGRIINKREPYELELDAVFEAAAETNTVLEINAYPDRLDLNDGNVFKAKRYGVLFAINTDAHRTSHLGLMKYGVATAARGWLTKANVLNCLEVSEVEEILRRKRDGKTR